MRIDLCAEDLMLVSGIGWRRKVSVDLQYRQNHIKY